MAFPDVGQRRVALAEAGEAEETVAVESASRCEPNAETVARLRAGDVAALEEVFRLQASAVLRLCRGLMGNSADAEDAVQEVFLRVYEQARKFDGRARFSTWVYRLAVWYCLNKLRQQRRRAAAEEVAGQQRLRLVRGVLPGRRGDVDEGALAAALLERLPPAHRVCVVLREVEGRTYAEIAELLEVPIGTVMSRLSRARRLLAAMLEEGSRNSDSARE